MDSNHEPLRYKLSALTFELSPQIVSPPNLFPAFFYVHSLEDIGDAFDAYKKQWSVLVFLYVHPAELLAVVALTEYRISQALWHLDLPSTGPSPIARRRRTPPLRSVNPSTQFTALQAPNSTHKV